MTLILMFIAWVVCGIWMWRCVGRPAKQCLQCIIGRYIALIVILLLVQVIKF